MEKKPKKIVIVVFLIIGVLGYSFIILFSKRDVVELLALVLFGFIVNYTSGFLSNNRTEYTLPDLIKLYLGLIVAIAIFYYIEPITVIIAK
ncbi:MAG: hypothetical protein PHR78_02895 [Eubacteriales bacterium]|nr:hypothetical protein [Eubacteriales bacterium]MDD4541101.1 hypothetical protein [Eubacteriales bacterium]